MPFFDIPQEEAKQPFAGVKIFTVSGERVMMAFVHFEPYAIVPNHSHPNEQMGMVLEGAFEFTIGEETRILQAGSVYWVPAGVEHSVRNLDHKTVALDIFSPPREEYR